MVGKIVSFSFLLGAYYTLPEAVLIPAPVSTTTHFPCCASLDTVATASAAAASAVRAPRPYDIATQLLTCTPGGI